MVLKLKKPVTNKPEVITLVLILFLSCFLRFWNLGYSHFYGDETKTLYLDKTVPAITFLLDQRKGPVQFLAAWVMEKISGSYNETYIRLPFALAGTLSILVFYLLAKKLFGARASLISAFLYSISGFSIAFSRTAQYQSFLILFGLLSVYLFIKALESGSKKWYVLSSVSFVLAMYSHYDAIFFLVPIVYMFIVQENRNVKKALLFFVLPTIILLSIFYVPYVLKGYLLSNTVNYVGRRMTGSEFEPNSSLYTFFVYNPVFLHFIYIGLAVVYLIFFRSKDKIRELFLCWFFVTLFFYNVLIANPGTHIQNYFLPLYIISGPAVLWFYSLIKINIFKSISLLVGFIFCVCLIMTSLFVYIPDINNGYPWSESKVGPFTIKAINKSDYNLYLYGFPYNRAWDQVGSYLNGKPGVRGYYTNDSAVTSKYYLQKYDLTPPGTNFLPQYYVDVENNMEFKKTDGQFLTNYLMEKQFCNDQGNCTSIYSLKK